MLTLGTSVPDFSAIDTHNHPISLSDFKGKFLILYFYPKDNTPGCTREAIEFTQKKAEFTALNAVVVGVSKDSPASHQKFCADHALDIPLISDGDRKIIDAYDVWKEKNLYGKTSFGILRSTFLISPDGKLIKIWSAVKVDGHVDAVLQALREVQP